MYEAELQESRCSDEAAFAACAAGVGHASFRGLTGARGGHGELGNTQGRFVGGFAYCFAAAALHAEVERCAEGVSDFGD